MIAVWFARVMGVVLAVAAVAGYFIEGEHMLGIMNVDVPLDVVRTVLAVALLVVGFARVPRAALNVVLALLGASYLLVAILGFIDVELWGLLPTGLTPFDLAFHLVVGAVAIGLMFSPPAAESRDAVDRGAAARASAAGAPRS